MSNNFFEDKVFSVNLRSEIGDYEDLQFNRIEVENKVYSIESLKNSLQQFVLSMGLEDVEVNLTQK